MPAAVKETSSNKLNLYILGWISFIRGMHTSIFGAIWQPFVLSLGYGISTIGFLNSFGGMGGIMGVSGIVTALIQPIGGWLSDHIGRKPIILLGGFFTIISYVLFSITGWSRSFLILIMGVLLLGLSSISRPVRRSMTADSATQNESGSAFSLVLLASLLPGTLTPIIGGFYVDQYGYPKVFLLIAFLEIVAIVIVSIFLKETITRANFSLSKIDLMSLFKRLYVMPKRELLFTIVIISDSMAWGFGWGLLYGLVSKVFSFSTTQIGTMVAVMSLSWAIMQIPLGKLIDRLGSLPMMIFSEVVGVLLLIIWLTQSEFSWFAFSMVLVALNSASWQPASDAYLAKSFSNDDRGEAFGRFAAIKDVAGFPGPIIGGLLFEWKGFHAPILVNLFIVLIVVIMLLVLLGQQRRKST